MVTVGFYLSCYPELEALWSYVPPLGFGYLSSYAKQQLGGKVDFVIERNLDDLIAHRPDLVCITYVTHNASRARRDAERIKRELGCPVLVGGPHISTFPVKLDPPFDLAVLSEGEETFVELLRLWLERGRFDTSDLSKIQGLLYREHGGVIRTPPRPGIKDLDRVPYPDRDMAFAKWRVGREDKPVHLQIMTSRGCPYDCSFCSTIIHWGRGFRYPSNQYVVDEIAMMREKYDVRVLDIFDDLYTVRRDRVLEINRMLRERGLHEGVEFTCFARSNLVDEELLEDMAKTNIKIIHMGLESGSDEILLKFNKQAASAQKNRDAVIAARNTGIEFTSCFILGAPGERREDIYETFAFVTEGLDVFRFAHFTPLMYFPGTRAWDWAVEECGVTPDNLAEKGIVMEPDDVATHEGLAGYQLDRIPYLNEKNIPRAEFNNLLRIGWQVENMVAQKSFQVLGLKQQMKDQLTPAFVAENVPFGSVVREKTRRRLKKLMPMDQNVLDEAPPLSRTS